MNYMLKRVLKVKELLVYLAPAIIYKRNELNLDPIFYVTFAVKDMVTSMQSET